MIKKFQLPRSEFARNVLVMMTGTTIAQAIPVAVSPILTRLYTPEDFGLLALYMSLVLLLGSVVTMKYDQAINLPVDDEDALGLVVLCSIIAFVTSSFLLLIVFLFSTDMAIFLGNQDIRPWLYVLPISMFASGMTTSLSYWFNRRKNFSTISKARVGQSAGTATAQLGLLLFISKFGMIVGAILGHIGTFAFLATAAYKDSRALDRKLKNRSNITSALRQYRKFPIYQAPAVFLETSSAQLPVIIITTFFGATAVGMYSLAHRVIRLPIMVISSSFGEVFRQAASEAYTKHGDARPIFLSSLKRLLLLSIVPFSLLFMLAPQLFSIVFGPEWRVAGDIARILAPMIWLSFIVSPLSAMFIIAEKQELHLVLQIGLVFSSFVSLWLGNLIFGSLKGALILFVSVYSVKYTIQLYLSYQFCIERKR